MNEAVENKEEATPETEEISEPVKPKEDIHITDKKDLLAKAADISDVEASELAAALDEVLHPNV